MALVGRSRLSVGGTMDPLVRGVIVFDRVSEALETATVHVRLEQTSLADAPAREVAATTIHGVPAQATGRLPFSLAGPPPDPRESYSLRVHVDHRGDGVVRPGDQVSYQSHPVLTFGWPDHVEIPVRTVAAPGS